MLHGFAHRVAQELEALLEAVPAGVDAEVGLRIEGSAAGEDAAQVFFNGRAKEQIIEVFPLGDFLAGDG